MIPSKQDSFSKLEYQAKTYAKLFGISMTSRFYLLFRCFHHQNPPLVLQIHHAEPRAALFWLANCVGHLRLPCSVPADSCLATTSRFYLLFRCFHHQNPPPILKFHHAEPRITLLWFADYSGYLRSPCSIPTGSYLAISGARAGMAQGGHSRRIRRGGGRSHVQTFANHICNLPLHRSVFTIASLVTSKGRVVANRDKKLSQWSKFPRTPNAAGGTSTKLRNPH